MINRISNYATSPILTERPRYRKYRPSAIQGIGGNMVSNNKDKVLAVFSLAGGNDL
jgi:hypothetical protein